jgi:hypothetical protein
MRWLATQITWFINLWWFRWLNVWWLQAPLQIWGALLVGGYVFPGSGAHELALSCWPALHVFYLCAVPATAIGHIAMWALAKRNAGTADRGASKPARLD